MIIVGLDLAGSENRTSGFCILNEKLEAKTYLFYKDSEIINKIIETKPNIVAIDAPLSLPIGRKSLEEKSNVHLRECDKELLRMKIKFFPITLGPMRKLTERGIRLKKKLTEFNFKIIEVFPGAAQDLLGIPRKNKGLSQLKAGLENIGIKGLKENMTGDELDAVTCALVGYYYLTNNYIEIGKKEEGTIILPKINYEKYKGNIL